MVAQRLPIPSPGVIRIDVLRLGTPFVETVDEESNERSRRFRSRRLMGSFGLLRKRRSAHLLRSWRTVVPPARRDSFLGSPSSFDLTTTVRRTRETMSAERATARGLALCPAACHSWVTSIPEPRRIRKRRTLLFLQGWSNHEETLICCDLITPSEK